MAADPCISIGSQNITQIKTTKALGIIVDEHVCWNDHIESIGNRVLDNLVLLV